MKKYVFTLKKIDLYPRNQFGEVHRLPSFWDFAGRDLWNGFARLAEQTGGTVERIEGEEVLFRSFTLVGALGEKARTFLELARSSTRPGVVHTALPFTVEEFDFVREAE